MIDLPIDRMFHTICLTWGVIAVIDPVISSVSTKKSALNLQCAVLKDVESKTPLLVFWRRDAP